MPGQASFFQRIQTRLRTLPVLPDLLSLVGGLVYAAQSITYIFTSRSMLDEGLYLLKGWYFATGQYAPFQDYGPLTNHMPLAFLIPGYVLKWFGPNLLTGRVYAVVLGIAAIAGLWLLARRLGGAWWAAFAVWALTLNVALVRIYSLGLSQVLVSALLTAVLLLSLRRDLHPRAAGLAGVLCGALLMVRINMLPFAGLWLVYLLWQHPRRVAWAGLAGMLGTLAVVHALYWPNILRLWAYWIPEGLIPALQPFYTPWDKFSGVQMTANWAWLSNLDDPSWNPIISFWQGLRFNFVAVIGVLLNLLLWPRRNSWPDVFKFRAAIFLNLAFVALFLIHAWAALGGNSCHEFCFSGYIGFFSALGLLSIVITAPHWHSDLHWSYQIFVGVVLVVVAAGVGFGSADNTGKFLAEFPVPLPSGLVPAWGLLENRFGVTYRDARKIVPALAGLGLGLALWIGAAIYRRRGKQARGQAKSAAGLALLSFFVLGYAMAPTPILSFGDETLQCGGNLPRAYEDLAAQMRPFVRPGDQIYYQGPNSPAILLYLSDIGIYPPQLNNVFSFSTDSQGASADTLLRFGYWNEELKQQWIEEADLILIEARRYTEWQAMVEAGDFDIVLITGEVEPCRGEDSSIVLLRALN
jgi:hypothetical protein